MDFVRDFFFTDIMNHVEFLKWTCDLDTKDDVLLVGILERLAFSDYPLFGIDPFYGSIQPHVKLPKNALHVAKAYARMRELNEHQLNVYEVAYLDPESFQIRSFFSAFIQVSFFYCICTYVLTEPSVRITPKEDGFELVLCLLFLSSTLFFLEVQRQRKNCIKFNRLMREFSQHSGDNERGRGIFLFLNRAINETLGIIIFLFNMYFILTSDDPTNAVLNSVALAFIIEIDDVFRPNWSDEAVGDALSKMLRGYIIQEPEDGEIVVLRDNSNGSKPNAKPRVLLEGENYYIHLGPFDPDLEMFKVVVFTPKQTDRSKSVTLSYQSTKYVVRGFRAKELHDSFRVFACLDGFRDIVGVPSVRHHHDTW